jgi:hypothetical protein
MITQSGALHGPDRHGPEDEVDKFFDPIDNALYFNRLASPGWRPSSIHYGGEHHHQHQLAELRRRVAAVDLPPNGRHHGDLFCFSPLTAHNTIPARWRFQTAAAWLALCRIAKRITTALICKGDLRYTSLADRHRHQDTGKM